MVENQTKSNMGCIKISAIMNEKFKKRGSNQRIRKSTVYKILKKHNGKPRKMKKRGGYTSAHNYIIKYNTRYIIYRNH